MKLLIIRHAIAEDKRRFAKTGHPDSKRPLTPEGRKKMKAVSKGIHNLCPRIHALGTSPYTRAAQTAEIVLKAYKKSACESVPSLVPGGSFNDVLHWLNSHKKKHTVAVVGHEPSLSRMIGWLVTGKPQSWMNLKKGGAVLLEWKGKAKRGKGQMLWMLKPSQLRKI